MKNNTAITICARGKRKGSVETPPVHTKTTQRENRLYGGMSVETSHD
jgi:hypothetical protein